MNADRNAREARMVARLVEHEEARERAAAAALVSRERSRARLARYAERTRERDMAGWGRDRPAIPADYDVTPMRRTA